MKFVALIGTDLDPDGAREITITVPDDHAERFQDGEAVQAVVQTRRSLARKYGTHDPREGYTADEMNKMVRGE